MKTRLIAAAVAASLVTAAAAVAQTPPPGGPPAGPPGASEGRGPGGPGGWGPGRRMMQMSPEDRAAMVDARLAAFKAMLRLRPDQERHWPALETALREAANQRFQRMTERFERRREMREGRGPAAQDPIQRMRAASERMAEGAATLRKIAEAAQPLYASLDEAQKRRAERMFMHRRGMMGGAMMMGAWHGGGDWGGRGGGWGGHGGGEWGGGRGGGWGDGPRRGGPGEGGGRL
ncbi:MAG: Spy/CpxP family protein refolding chaperone [Phreatobacter sp.]